METRRTALNRACEGLPELKAQEIDGKEGYIYHHLVVEPNARLWYFRSQGGIKLEGGTFREGLTKDECLRKIRFLIGIIKTKEKLETALEADRTQGKLL